MSGLDFSTGTHIDVPVRILANDKSTLEQLTEAFGAHHIPAVACQDTNQFFRKDQRHDPLCIVLDWRGAEKDGLELAARCRMEWPRTAVILLCEGASVSFAVAAMRKGVDGVLEKPPQVDELIQEVRSAIEASRARFIQHYERLNARTRIAALNDTERKILSLIAGGIPNKNIAVAMDISLRTVEKYRHSLFEALRVSSAAEATRIWVLGNMSE